MAIRQYVGARYVPIFDGDWDNTKDYDPLVIVSYQGNSYTSRTFVPAGIDINNITYWALTGNYNAQVEAYRQEVLQLSNNVGDVNDLETTGDSIVDGINQIFDDVFKKPYPTNLPSNDKTLHTSPLIISPSNLFTSLLNTQGKPSSFSFSSFLFNIIFNMISPS